MEDNNKTTNKKNKPIKCNKRLFIFVMGLIVCFFIAISKLIEYQIIDYEKYDRILHSKNQIKEIIPAARGDIVDRNGVVLATNELNLSLIIGENFPLKSVEDDKETGKAKNIMGNNIIIKLINILDRENLDWEENSPITKTKPYAFVEDKSYEVEKLKKALSQQQYATAQDTIDLLVEKFDIDKDVYSEKQVRDIAVFRANMLIKSFSEYNKTFIVLKKVEPEFLDKITGIGDELKGVRILETSRRVYPFKEFGAHFIGNVGPLFKEDYERYKEKGYSRDAIVGKFGIEEKYEDQLRAQNGVLIIQKDEEGNTINKFYEREPKPGNTVRLSIDIKFQQALQEALPGFISGHHMKYGSGKGATVCVLSVATGEVLSLISYPSFDLNEYNSKYDEYQKAKYNPLKNRATIELYRPGSTFKPFIALTGLMCGAITPSTKFVCRDGIMPHMRCAHHSHGGVIDIYTAIQRSCNNYFYQAGDKIGIDNIDKYAPYFGFGVDTGFELYNSLGRVTNPSKEFQRKYNTTYRRGDLWQTSIGQSEVYTTILQQAVSQLTIARKGERLATHIVKSIEDPNKNIIFKTKPRVMSKFNIPDFAYDTVTKGMEMMWNVKPFAHKYKGYCKSGSPQYSHNTSLTNGAGVGLYPAGAPKLAMAILVEDGQSAENYFEIIAREFEKRKEERKNEIEEERRKREKTKQQ